MSENHIPIKASKITKNTIGVVHLSRDNVIDVVALYKFAIHHVKEDYAEKVNFACIFASQTIGLRTQYVYEIIVEYRTTNKVEMSYEVNGKMSKICFPNVSNNNETFKPFDDMLNFMGKEEIQKDDPLVGESELYKQIRQELKSSNVVS